MLSVIAALSANILVAISKFVGFILSGSAAMLNESIHSVVDCSNQILLLVGDKQARKPASALHPFGQARAKYFYSVIVAMLLFFGGGALGTMEAMQKLFHPKHMACFGYSRCRNGDRGKQFDHCLQGNQTIEC